jgi:hypothetical protein
MPRVRLLASVLVLLVAGCAAIGMRPVLDDAARDYVRLVLEIGTHEDGYVDAYYGPPEWKAEAEAHPRTLPQLKAEADRIAAVLRQADAAALPPAERRRNASLLAHVASARFRLDMISGTRAPFQEEAFRLFALRPELRPLESYDPILARIALRVPGSGDLSERVEAFRNRYVIARDRLQAVMDAAIQECARRTRAHLQLPQDERFTMEFVTGKAWGAYNWYQGGNRSLIQINTDLPLFIDRALALGCHEGYPGHHVQTIARERQFRELGRIEFSVLPLFAPPSPLYEGGADFGIELAFPGEERLRFEAETLYPLAGLDPAAAPAYDALRRDLEQLAGARLTISALYLDGQIDRERALALTQHYLLVSRPRAERSVAFDNQYRSYVINYATGEDLVRAYIARLGADEAARWSAYAQIYAEPTLPQDLVP